MAESAVLRPSIHPPLPPLLLHLSCLCAHLTVASIWLLNHPLSTTTERERQTGKRGRMAHQHLKHGRETPQRERGESVGMCSSIQRECVCAGGCHVEARRQDFSECMSWRWEMGAAMCKLSDKVGQHVRKKSTGRIMGLKTHTHLHVRGSCRVVLGWIMFVWLQEVTMNNPPPRFYLF